MQRKNSKLALILPLTLFVIAAFIFNCASSFDLTRYNPDFGFYYTYAYQKFILQWHFFQPNAFVDSLYSAHYRYDPQWTPTPFYSLICLFVLFLPFGKYLFALQGIILGCFFFALVHATIRKYFKQIPYNFPVLLITMSACCFQSTIFSSLISSSTMGVFASLVLFAVSTENLIQQSFTLCFAVLIRANSVLYIISFLISLLVCKPKNYINVIYRLIPPIIVFIVAYQTIFSGYGLSFPASLFISQGSTSWSENYNNFINLVLGVNQPYEYFKANGGSLKLFLNFTDSYKGIHFVFVNIYQKILMMVGFPWDVHFSGDPSLVQPRFWITKTMYIVWFWAFIAPSLLIFSKGLLNLSLSRQFRCIIMSYFIFIIFSSLLIAGERYALPYIPILIFTSTVFWLDKYFWLKV